MTNGHCGLVVRAERTFSSGPQHLCQRLRTATSTVAFDPAKTGAVTKMPEWFAKANDYQANEQAGALYDLAAI